MNYIYKITNNVDSKSYIGFTISPKRRWSQHKFSAKHESKEKLYHAIKKHGIENFSFEVIYCSKDKDHTINVMEEFFIQKFNTREYGYNTALGGSVRRIGCKHSPETIALLKEQRKNKPKGKDSPIFGTKHSEISKNLQRQKHCLFNYTIIFESGKTITTDNILEFTKTSTYNDKYVYEVLNGKRKKYRDIISVSKESKNYN